MKHHNSCLVGSSWVGCQGRQPPDTHTFVESPPLECELGLATCFNRRWQKWWDATSKLRLQKILTSISLAHSVCCFCSPWFHETSRHVANCSCGEQAYMVMDWGWPPATADRERRPQWHRRNWILSTATWVNWKADLSPVKTRLTTSQHFDCSYERHPEDPVNLCLDSLPTEIMGE